MFSFEEKVAVDDKTNTVRSAGARKKNASKLPGFNNRSCQPKRERLTPSAKRPKRRCEFVGISLKGLQDSRITEAAQIPGQRALQKWHLGLDLPSQGRPPRRKLFAHYQPDRANEVRFAEYTG